MTKILSYLKIKDIRTKLLFTLLLFLVFRFMAAVPLPGIPLSALKDLFSSNSTLQVMGMVSGGVLASASLISVGLGPYINASYVFQLLSAVVPKIKELYEGGPAEKRMLSMYTRLLSIPFAIMQAFGVYVLLRQANIIGNLSGLELGSLVVLLTFGAVFTMWLGELITESGIGQGSSLIITAGILVSIPANLALVFGSLVEWSNKLIVIGILAILLVLSLVLSLAEYRVRIQYAKRVRASGAGGIENYIPLRLNQSGVMPVIFAIAVVSFPSLVFGLLANQSRWLELQSFATRAMEFVNDPTVYAVTLLVALIFFTFFSAFMVFRPKEVSENLAKSSVFIPGVRPGLSTETYLRKLLINLTVMGAFILAILTVLPTAVVNWMSLPNLVVSGTGILIITSVIIDTVAKIEAIYLTEAKVSKLI